jgi:uncharacterized protein (TIGR03083 family)
MAQPKVTDEGMWVLIHTERAAMADTLEDLMPGQWDEPSLCAGWSVQVAAGHIVNGAEQTPGRFAQRMVVNGLRFNATMDRDARQTGSRTTAEIIGRLRARQDTTNHPPGPVAAMLGEIVVHGQDIRRPLGLSGNPDPAAVVACLEMFSGANFPLGAKKRIAGLRVVATDVDWSRGEGPEVRGPGVSLIMAMTGRAAGMEGLAGDGEPALRARVAAV